MAKLSLYLPGSMCFIFWWSHCDRVYDMFKKYRIPTSRDIIFFHVRILSPSIYIFVFYNLHPHHLSFSLSITRVKGMLAKESSLVTVLHYSTMLSSSSLSLCLSLSTEQLSLHSRSLHSTKSQQHRTKCSSNDKTLNVS